jgi:beta-1,4-N-acetylglucosaminyltransferase
MIFVTVGTTDFDALVRLMDGLAPTLSEPVVAQIGRGEFVPEHVEWFRLAPDLRPYYAQADVVVSHGGLGTLVEVLTLGKRLIGVSNPDRYDRHQEDLLGYLESQQQLVWCRDLSLIPALLREIRSMTFAPYSAPPCTIAEEIRSYLGLRR